MLIQPAVKSNGSSTTDISNVLTLQEQIKAMQSKLKEEKAKAKNPAFEPSAERSEYQGKPMLRLKAHSGFEKFPFQFGAKKARLIVALFDQIKAFDAEVNKDIKF